MIQLQEPTPEDSVARKAGFKTISEIGKERIRRVIARMKKDQDKSDQRDQREDLGFKAFKLSRSNCFVWDPEKARDSETLVKHVDESAKGATKAEAESLVFELMLREGFRLDAQIERIRKAKNEFFKISDDKHLLWICLEERIDNEDVRSLGLTKDDKLIVLDDSLTDTQKINLTLTARIETV